MWSVECGLWNVEFNFKVGWRGISQKERKKKEKLCSHESKGGGDSGDRKIHRGQLKEQV